MGDEAWAYSVTYRVRHGDNRWRVTLFVRPDCDVDPDELARTAEAVASGKWVWHDWLHSATKTVVVPAAGMDGAAPGAGRCGAEPGDTDRE